MIFSNYDSSPQLLSDKGISWVQCELSNHEQLMDMSF